MRVLKENPALAVGIGLPILVVIFFAVATIVPSWLVAPPQYDVLFAVNIPNYAAHEPSNGEIKFAASNGHLKAYRRFDPKQACCPNNMQLYMFEAKTGRVHEIFIEPVSAPANADGNWKEFTVPEAEKLQIDPSTIAPDGYEFHDRSGYGGEVWPFFAGHSVHDRMAIGKQGREVTIPLPVSNNIYISNAQFIGWVVGKDGK
jgi:hypothetical protein